ncbi:MAG: glycosyltransferase family 4 protein [Candidatus Magasanikbacteria bacterium]
MKKILIVSLEFPPEVGGIASYVDQFASALDPEQVCVLAPPKEGAEEHDSKKDYNIYRKKFLFPKFIWPRWMMLFLSIRSVVKQEDIDILYLHHIIPIGYVAYLFKKIYQLPFLIFSHGIDIISATRTDWKKYWVNKVIDASEQIITNSESLNERLLQRVEEIPEEKTTVLYPCPEDKFKTKPAQKKINELENRLGVEGKQVMLTVARLVKGKGIEHLVKLMPEILKERPHLVWVIVGDGPERENMEELIRKYNLQNVVRFVGEKEHDELPPYYYLADLFVELTHPHHGVEEGLGLVFLEAAAAGLPVVAGESGGVEEAVVDKETGYVVGTFRDEEVTEKITKLLDDRELAREMGQKAKERIEEKFIWKKQLKKIQTWR